MSYSTKWIAISVLATLTFACAGNDSDDGNTANRTDPQNPVEVPTPAPTPAPPTSFEWSSVVFEDDSKLSPMLVTCTNRVRFTVRRDGSYSATETCSNLRQSGKITTEERATLRGLMEDIAASEARAKLKCKDLGADDPKEYLKISMTTEAAEKFTLLRQNDESICSAGDPAEVDKIKQYLYQLKSLYVMTDVL